MFLKVALFPTWEKLQSTRPDDKKTIIFRCGTGQLVIMKTFGCDYWQLLLW